MKALGSAPVSIIFESGWSGAVLGLTLADERQVVVKVRAFEERLIGCGQAQEALASAGYPCPRLLVPPIIFGPGLLISAETYLPSGPLTDPDPDVMAALLHRLIDLAPPLCIEPPAWAYPDHQSTGRWPHTQGDRHLDTDRLPEWLADLTDAVRAAALAWDVPEVVGHCDFEAQNLGVSGLSTTWTASPAARRHSTQVSPQRSGALTRGTSAPPICASPQRFSPPMRGTAVHRSRRRSQGSLGWRAFGSTVTTAQPRSRRTVPAKHWRPCQPNTISALRLPVCEHRLRPASRLAGYPLFGTSMLRSGRPSIRSSGTASRSR
jgi:hypothetical protein